MLVTVPHRHVDGVAEARTLEQTHQGRGLRADGSYLVLKWLRPIHFRRSFEVGNAGRSYAGSDSGNGLDGLENRRRFNEATQGVSGFKKHPHLSESEHWLPQNAASSAMVWLADDKNSLGRA